MYERFSKRYTTSKQYAEHRLKIIYLLYYIKILKTVLNTRLNHHGYTYICLINSIKIKYKFKNRNTVLKNTLKYKYFFLFYDKI